MGFLNSLFGTSSDKHSQEERSLSGIKIKELVSTYKVRSLNAKEEALVEQSIIDRRKGDGKISLRQIDEALRKLENTYKISEHDRKGIMSVFKKYFSSK